MQIEEIFLREGPPGAKADKKQLDSRPKSVLGSEIQLISAVGS